MDREGIVTSSGLPDEPKKVSRSARRRRRKRLLKKEACAKAEKEVMDGFVWPPIECGAKPFGEDEIVEKLPLPLGLKLLANEEFGKEIGVYESEPEEDEDDASEDLHVEHALSRDIPSKKRKSSNKMESSKEGTVISAGLLDGQEKVSRSTRRRRRKRVLKREACTKAEKEVMDGFVWPPIEHGAKTFGEVEIVEKLPLSLGLKLLANEEFEKEIGVDESEPGEDEDEANEDLHVEHALSRDTPSKKRKYSNETESSKEGTVTSSGLLDGQKKVSRSTRRKRMKRQFKREAFAKGQKEVPGEQPVSTEDSNINSEFVIDAKRTTTWLKQEDEDGDTQGDIFPIVIKPEDICFAPFEKGKDVQRTELPMIDFPSVVDVRIVKHGDLIPSEANNGALEVSAGPSKSSVTGIDGQKC